MFTLYMDNFRGFKDTHLPLKGMNFFVGENSSGKSSALSLIHLLNQDNFWNKNQWYSEDYYYYGTIEEVNRNYKKGTLGLYNTDGDILFFGFNKDKRGFVKVLQLSTLATDLEGKIFYEIHGRIENNLFFLAKKQIHTEINKHVNPLLINKWKEIDWKKAKRINLINYSGKKHFKYVSKISGINMIENLNSSTMMIFLLQETGLDGFKGVLFSSKTYWFAPIRTKPQRTYDQYIDNFTADGKHIPYLLRNIVNDKSDKNQAIIEAIDEFGKKSGLFEKMIVKQYGESINAPFEIQFQLADGTYRISNVGYGVSQVLPLIVQILADQQDAWFMIQQPEVHLHPKAQSALGEFFFAAFEKGKKIFVETHSDFIIDGFRRKLAESPQAETLAEQAQVVFFEKEGEGNRLNCIDIEADGEYKVSEATERFRSFFVQEALQNIGL